MLVSFTLYSGNDKANTLGPLGNISLKGIWVVEHPSSALGLLKQYDMATSISNQGSCLWPSVSILSLQSSMKVVNWSELQS